MIEGFLCPSEVRREPLVHATCGTIGGVGDHGLAHPDVHVLTLANGLADRLSVPSPRAATIPVVCMRSVVTAPSVSPLRASTAGSGVRWAPSRAARLFLMTKCEDKGVRTHLPKRTEGPAHK